MAKSKKVPKWRRQSESEVQYNRFWKLLKIKAELPTGAKGTFYVRHPGRPLVCALVITPDNRIVLIEQYRVGPDKVLAELPGGAAEPKENPARAITREVLEETGYRGRVQFVGSSYHEAWNTALRYHYVITDAVQVSEPKYDRFEFGRTLTMSLREFRQYIRSGGPTDIETAYLGLDFLKLL